MGERLSHLRLTLFVHELQHDPTAIKNLFANLLEIDGNPSIDNGLYLSDSPFGSSRMTHQQTRLEESVEIIHDKGLLMSEATDQKDGGPPKGEPDLIALLGSRLCHDLVNPIGAVSNGLELLEMSPGDGKAEMSLIRESLDAAMARIKFFRMAFGPGSDTAMITAREMRATLNDMYGQTRTRVIWRDEAERSRAEMRLACLALTCIEVATPWGAEVEVVRNEAAWVMHVDAKRLRIDDTLWQTLGRAPLPADLKGSEVQFGILARLTRDLRRPVSVSADETHLSLIV